MKDILPNLNEFSANYVQVSFMFMFDAIENNRSPNVRCYHFPLLPQRALYSFSYNLFDVRLPHTDNTRLRWGQYEHNIMYRRYKYNQPFIYMENSRVIVKYLHSEIDNW